MLQFHKNGEKWYAKTQHGEIVVCPNGRIYQWHMGVRIDYSGDDRQHSSNGEMWNFGDSPPSNMAVYMGIVYAVSNSRRN